MCCPRGSENRLSLIYQWATSDLQLLRLVTKPQETMSSQSFSTLWITFHYSLSNGIRWNATSFPTPLSHADQCSLQSPPQWIGFLASPQTSRVSEWPTGKSTPAQSCLCLHPQCFCSSPHGPCLSIYSLGQEAHFYMEVNSVQTHRPWVHCTLQQLTGCVHSDD